MISPEILRRYPFFSSFDDAALKAVAMISEEVCFTKGETVYETGRPNSAVLLLEEGSIESYLVVEDPNNPHNRREFYLDDLDTGEVFGISAMVETKIHTTTARAGKPCKLVRIDAAALEKLCAANPQFGYTLMKEMAGVLLSRLHQDRIQLAAAR
ncbi:MAG TPA: cyclic nucleotide-binding domain-containing protein [Anaerolineaceae bacterium]|jgi:CRP-like cAMP-binding protein